MKNADIKTFLRESNAIEDVWDKDSLVQAERAWEFLIKKKKLSREIILKTHLLLMKNQDIQENEKGQYRQIQVWIAGYEAKPWYAVPELMMHWINRANTTLIQAEELELEKDEKDEAINGDHIKFEEIHPFVDGNGRTGRLLWQWQRVKSGLPIKVIYEREKREYYKWFAKPHTK